MTMWSRQSAIDSSAHDCRHRCGAGASVTIRLVFFDHSRTDYRAHKTATVDRCCGSGQCGYSCRWRRDSALSPRDKVDRRRTNPGHLVSRSICIASASRPGPLARAVSRIAARERCIKSIPPSGSSARKRTPPPTPRTSLVTVSMNEDPYTR